MHSVPRAVERVGTGAGSLQGCQARPSLSCPVPLPPPLLIHPGAHLCPIFLSSVLRTVSQGLAKTTPANKPPRSTFTSDKPTATDTAAPPAPRVIFYKICIHKHKQQRRRLLSCKRKKLSGPSSEAGVLNFKSLLCRGGEHILLGWGKGKQRSPKWEQKSG